MSPWIRVEERLPERGTNVLITYEAFGERLVTEAYCLVSAWRWRTGDAVVELDGRRVVSWMPLPEPDGRTL